MKKIIFLTVALLFAFSFSNISAQSEKSCCNKSMNMSSCDKNMKNSSNDKSKTSMNSEKGEKETVFKVSGKCEMCEARIEKAALGVKGVKTAEWDKTTKLLKVSFDGNTSKKDIEKAIADVGHDTPDFKAKDAVYNALPGCCKYER